MFVVVVFISTEKEKTFSAQTCFNDTSCAPPLVCNLLNLCDDKLIDGQCLKNEDCRDPMKLCSFGKEFCFFAFCFLIFCFVFVCLFVCFFFLFFFADPTHTHTHTTTFEIDFKCIARPATTTLFANNVSATSVGSFPWWGALLIVLAIVIVVAAGVVGFVYWSRLKSSSSSSKSSDSAGDVPRITGGN